MKVINYKSKRTNKCLDCGAAIYYDAKRCKSCSAKIKIISLKTRKKLSISKLNKKNPMWKGNKVKYDALHAWVRRHKPKPKLCEDCKKRKPYDLANISGKYKRDINDYKWVCRSCHMKGDGRVKSLYTKKVKCIICKKIFLGNKRSKTCSNNNCKKEYLIFSNREWKRKEGNERKKRGLCVKCGKNKPIINTFYCKNCLDYWKKYWKNVRSKK
jgi:hypothetical protein